jgi:hypothetical protein
MPLLFALKEFGRAFATRERGAELRTKLVALSADGDQVVVDFGGVSNISYSFADEFLGVLASDGSCHREVEAINMTSPVDRIVRDALSRRRGEPVPC